MFYTSINSNERIQFSKMKMKQGAIRCRIESKSKELIKFPVSSWWLNHSMGSIKKNSFDNTMLCVNEEAYRFCLRKGRAKGWRIARTRLLKK